MSTFIRNTIITDDNIQKLVTKYIKKKILPVDLQDIPIGDWDVSNVTNMESLFEGAKNFNEPLNNWNVSNVTDMGSLFEGAKNFNQPLNNWNVSNVTHMAGMFSEAKKFNQSLNNWNVSNVTDMTSMFSEAKNFNQPLNNWNVSNVTNMSYMFSSAENFNQLLNNWNVSNVTDMRYMFSNDENFNQPLNDWNVSNVTNMDCMFINTPNFNQPLNNWNVSNVTTMIKMFNLAINFNQPLNNWNVSNVTDMTSMFEYASRFNQDLTGWNIRPDANTRNIFSSSGMSQTNMPEVLRPTPQQQAAQQAVQGIAYQVHNASDKINTTKLIELISPTNAEIPYTGTEVFHTYMKTQLKEFVDTYTEEDKNDLITKWNGLNTKIGFIRYENPNFYNTILEFVKQQPKEYQNNYIKYFIIDSFSAYDTGVDTTSCLKGIKERMIFALGQAGVGLTDPKYQEIALVIFPPANDAIHSYLNDCITEKKDLLIGKTMEEKKAIMLNCVNDKFTLYYPNTTLSTLNIPDKIDQIEDMLDDDAMSGGKRRTTMKRRTMKRRTMKRKTMKRRTMKRRRTTKKRRTTMKRRTMKRRTTKKL